MFLRSNNRKKDGKEHRYFSIVENHRTASGAVVGLVSARLGVGHFSIATASRPKTEWRSRAGCKELSDDAAKMGECCCQNLGNRRCDNLEMAGGR
jgi:hypothetical protein